PTRLYEVTVMKIATPGNAVNHQALGSNCRALYRMEPQLAVDGGAPNPRKLRVDSSKIADATPSVAATNTGAREFGSRCRTIVRKSVAPSARVATTYSSDFAFKNSARMSRATVGQFVRPITTMTVKILWGRKATTVMIRNKVGIVSMISIRRDAM